MAPNYSLDQIPVTLAAVFNFTCEHQPEENHDDGGEDEDGSQPIGRRVEVDDDDVERNEGFDECNERRDQIAGEMWAQYLAEHTCCGIPLPEVEM